ncbi:unnamed protein product [Effrenium voratum]|nr:unnamed protein product [Effrenium voratum]CAJ1418564.1 unnamed protein product [Effrenium voratum]|mmetsp:Transcript_119690/g.284337  ORF Transcript_119690/g.284337 Transcript_119690/m.284337 type:complete len:185 (+) Transcript_119690:35-589(+)
MAAAVPGRVPTNSAYPIFHTADDESNEEGGHCLAAVLEEDDLAKISPGGRDRAGTAGSGLSLASTCSSTSHRNLRQTREAQLKQFLRANKCKEVNESVDQQGCLSLWKERLFPLHIAARNGDKDMVRILLAAGADSEQKTSRGRTAADLARHADKDRSHQDVLALLSTDVKVVDARTLQQMGRM